MAGMAELQFYKNKYYYPHYSNSITTHGSPMTCTPVGIGTRKGSITIETDMEGMMDCNYIHIDRGGARIYAWVDDVTYHSDVLFDIHYTVDAWRTYKNKIDLDTQFIKRRPQSTYVKDDMLGSAEPRPDVETTMFDFGNPNERVFVVQVRVDVGEIFSRTPVQPSPYRFYVTPYNVNNWTASSHLDELMTRVTQDAEPQNIVTMYSVPYFDTSSLPAVDLTVKTADSSVGITGFKMFNDNTNPANLLYNEAFIDFSMFSFNTDEIMRTDHSIQVVIPEAGVINVPNELVGTGSLHLRQDIDVFSGACNYMLFHGAYGYTGLSARGSSISSIPIVSDPLDTYMSQNQNALATSLIGDVASIVGGGAIAIGSGGIGGAVGGGAIATGATGLANRFANTQDAGNRYNNPPAFLGTALASNFNGKFWVIATTTNVTNDSTVHSNFGYAYNLVGDLTFPSNGFIQTEGCGVFSTDGTVPRWAIDEVNAMFDQGIMVHSS